MAEVFDLPRVTVYPNEVDDVPEMTFSSLPVHYVASSSPPAAPATKQKRRLFQTLCEQQPLLKKPRLALSSDHQQLSKKAVGIDIGSDKENTDAVFLRNQSVSTKEAKLPSTARVQPTPVRLEPSDTTTPNFGRGLTKRTVELKTCAGKTLRLRTRKRQPIQTYEQTIAERSGTADGRARKSYYGIEIHQLVDDAKTQAELDTAAREFQAQKEADIQPSIERPNSSYTDHSNQTKKQQMWTEKYRAKKFTELVGDERTHRSVLKWLKAWDDIVFPGAAKFRPKQPRQENDHIPEYQHRKIMLLTGPPGLGKTTLAHVCAKQAGYEVLEINASDDRSRDVVRGRIKDALGTETVRGIREPGKNRKAGRPVCVVVDEVDGVVTGSGSSGGEGGFTKALIDLVQLDQRNRSQAPSDSTTTKLKKKGDRFKLLRPLILICNDVYAPSLRPLRQSSMAEIVHVRKPPLDKVITRLKTVFEKENIRCDNDAIRRLCEDCWGLGSRKQSTNTSRGTGDGDIRGVLVQGEWMAHKLRANNEGNRLTRKWVESQLNASSKTSKSMSRGGIREVVDRIFLEGAGLPQLPTTLSVDEARQVKQARTALGVADLRKRSAITALREMIDTCGDHDRVMTDCFITYGTQIFQDDTLLSKPNASYDWLHFHDSLSSRIFSGQEWELNPYLSTSACAFHNLFASLDKGQSSWPGDGDKHDKEEEIHPFSGPKADFAAYEAEKANRAILSEMQSNFSGELLRLFSSMENVATELIPLVSRILSPDVKPVVVGGSGGGPSVASVRKESERNCVRNSVQVMSALNIAFEKVRIESEGYGGGATISGGYALRMEPPIDTLSTYQIDKTMLTGSTIAQPTRYAIRQVIDQELQKEKILQASLSRQARGRGAHSDLPLAVTTDGHADEKLQFKATQDRKPVKVKRDFFGRIIETMPSIDPVDSPAARTAIDASSIAKSTATKGKAKNDTFEGDGSAGGRIWVSFHEGFSNAVRKPITLADLMDGF